MFRNVYAQAVDTALSDPLAGTFGSEVQLSSIFGLIINVVIGIGIALTVIFLVLGGIQYVTSRGDAKAADTARGSLTNAVIGFIVVLAAVTIRYVVSNVLGGNTSGFENIAV